MSVNQVIGDGVSGRESHGYAPVVKRELVVLDLCFVAVLLLGFIVVAYRTELLPERFMGDEKTIRELALGTRSAYGDNSYGTVAAIYRHLDLADSQFVAGLLGYLAACVPYFVVLSRYRYAGGNYGAVFTLSVGVLLSAVYMGTYSKEVFVVPIVIALLLCRPRVSGGLVICGLVAVYAACFRNYWFLLLVVFVLMMITLKRIKAVGVVLVIAVVAVLTGSFVFSSIMGVPADHFRDTVNEYRLASGNVNTLIPRYLSTGTIADGPLNNTISFVTLQLPIPLLIKLSPYYVALALVLTTLWIGFYSRMPLISRLGDSDHQAVLLRGIAFVLAFSITQAFFEPDYGSALKHLTPFLPIFLMAYLGARSKPNNLTERGV